MADKIKLSLAVLALIAGFWGFYYYDAQPTVVRVLMVLAGFALCAAIGYSTAAGHAFAGFVKESRAELRRVVWPTRKETMQMTLIVFAMVVAVALFLWLVDWSLLKIMRAITQPGA
jgi:preprotein translocase subunit SecE